MSWTPYFAEGTPAMVDLEKMVDRAGMRNVLWALAKIAFAKAKLLEDDELATDWSKRGNALDRFAAKMRNIPAALRR